MLCAMTTIVRETLCELQNVERARARSTYDCVTARHAPVTRHDTPNDEGRGPTSAADINGRGGPRCRSQAAARCSLRRQRFPCQTCNVVAIEGLAEAKSAGAPGLHELQVYLHCSWPGAATRPPMCLRPLRSRGLLVCCFLTLLSKFVN